MSTQSFELGRRDFVTAGAMGVAALGVPVASRAQGLFSVLAPEASALGLGFREGARLRSAGRLTAEAQLWADDLARITVHGLYREDSRPDLRALWLDVAFAPDRSRVFHAWSFNRDPVLCKTAATSFVVPVRTSEGLRLNLGATLGDGASVEEPLVLGFGPHHGLRTGTYAVALQQGTTPWRWLRWQGEPETASADGVLYTGSAESARPADFPYLLISVERAA
ncbi:MAG: hypothetical protein ABIJ09_17795 [Pseudomonadota bacterium]